MTRKRTSRGFTLVELAVVLAIIVVLSALAIPNIARQRPRARLASATAELQSLLHAARQQALASGRDVWVVVFPSYANGDSTGRVVVYEDGSFDFSVANAPGGMDLDRFSPVTQAVGAASQIVTTMDLPTTVTFGTDGSAPVALVAPLAGINTTVACSFCGNLSDGRGGIRFDSRGRASFYGRAGAPLTTTGGALNVTAAPSVAGTRTLVVTPRTGVVQVLTNG
jgi:prepilin-type N-terminal cleavage/methylation domain-containing protein